MLLQAQLEMYFNIVLSHIASKQPFKGRSRIPIPQMGKEERAWATAGQLPAVQLVVSLLLESF